MEINLVTISKLSSEIIDKDIIKIEHVDCPVLSELSDNIYDKYPALWRSGDYKLFWQYAANRYLQIFDYISYATAIGSMVNRSIYVLLDDFGDYWEDNISYLENLDRIEEELRIERERNIYDIRVRRDVSLTVQVMLEVNSNKSMRSMSSIDEIRRTDNDVISYACRNEPKFSCYTTDLVEKMQIIENLKSGYPKIRTELRAIPNVVFEKRALKDPKGQTGKKDKKGDKKNKSDKKNKKGGKKK